MHGVTIKIIGITCLTKLYELKILYFRKERTGWKNRPIMGRSGYYSVIEIEKKKVLLKEFQICLLFVKTESF
jgi:hypothetical protein